MKITIEEIRSIVEKAETMADMDTLINDAPLTEQNVDSLDMANILLMLEETYEVKIPDTDLDKLQSIDGIVQYLNNK